MLLASIHTDMNICTHTHSLSLSMDTSPTHILSLSQGGKSKGRWSKVFLADCFGMQVVVKVPTDVSPNKLSDFQTEGVCVLFFVVYVFSLLISTCASCSFALGALEQLNAHSIVFLIPDLNAIFLCAPACLCVCVCVCVCVCARISDCSETTQSDPSSKHLHVLGRVAETTQSLLASH
jgi:hypothetical protein